jgi:hypothetical protein
MQLSIYYVNPAGREWQTWLEEGTANPPSTKDLGNQVKYFGSSRFLCLVHPSKQLTEEDQTGYEAAWKALANRDSVLWLFYSASGYPRAESRVPNIHYLRYEITDQLRPAELECFRALIKELRSDDKVDPAKVWQLLYPPDNVAAASLLALLTARECVNVDVSSALAALLKRRDELRKTYMEYCGAMAGNRDIEPLSYLSWTKFLEEANYSPIRTELERVLGAVPD